MKGKTKLALLTVIMVLGVVLLAGCSGYWEFRREMKQMETLASGQALTYIQETYGVSAEIEEIKVGTSTVLFSATVDTNALVTVALGEETFQVYVETKEPAFCEDNRGGLLLTQTLDLYFRGLYGLPKGLEQSVRVYVADKDFFASRPTNLAREYSFLNFDYHGQPLETIFPLLDSIVFSYDYLDNQVSFARVDVQDKDWGGDAGKVRAQLRCFRTYREDGRISLGIGFEEDHLVLLAEGMQFSRRGKEYGSLDDIAEALPAFALREAITWRERKCLHARYELTAMGDFWISTREGLSAKECFTLTTITPDWTRESDKMGAGKGIYYTRAEILEGVELTKTTRKTLLPFVDAGYQQIGEMLLPQDDGMERMAAWKEDKPSWDHSNLPPVQVMVIPSLVYGSDKQMGVGLYWNREDESQQVVQLFTDYLNQKTRWTHGLVNLTFNFPGPVEGIALLQVTG